MNKYIKANPDKCIGCRTCMISCVVAHEGNEIFHMDPDAYSFNPKLHMVKTKEVSIPIQCKHCEDPACMAACPNNCISFKDDIVYLDSTECIGCKACMAACPYGAIDMVVDRKCVQKDGAERMVANKCDLCINVPGGPQCVSHCPTDALTLVSDDELSNGLDNRRKNALKSNVNSKRAGKNTQR